MSARVGDGGAASAAGECDRRALLRRGLTLGGAAIAASSIPLLLSARDAFAASDGDGAILLSAITLERVAVLAYDTVLEGDLLSPSFAAVVRRLRDHERAHAEALTTALTDLGSTPPPAPQGVADVDRVVKGLRDVRTQADVATFAIALEMATVAAYHDAQAKLVEARLMQTCASITACEGQHLVALRRALGDELLPRALETGRP